MALCERRGAVSKDPLRAWEGGRSPVDPSALATILPTVPTAFIRASGVVKPTSEVFSGVSGSGR